MALIESKLIVAATETIISAASTTHMLSLHNTTNGAGCSINFSDITNGSQHGTIDFLHQDSASQGGGASFHITSTEADMVLVVGGRITATAHGSNAEVDYGFVGDINTGMMRSGADAIRFVTGGTAALDINSSQNATFAANTTFVGIVMDGNTITGIDDSDEFTDDDNHIMTSAAINDKFGARAGSSDITTVGTITSGLYRADAISTANTEAKVKSVVAGTNITVNNSGVGDVTVTAKLRASFDFKGYSTHNGSTYEIPQAMTDTNAPFEHNTSVGSAGTTAIAVSLLLRAGGTVMPYAGTIKKWTGWAAGSGSGAINIALFRYRPNPESSSAQSLVLIDNQALTAAGAQTVAAIEQTSFTDGDIAAGDVIMTGLKGVNNKTTYFTSTMEIEWD